MSGSFENRALKVRCRVLQILAALERAGGTPIANRDLHAFAYLANVLSPLWEVEPLEGSVLKNKDGPRSSEFENQLDLCIGQGLIIVDALVPDPENQSRLEASYRISAKAARPVLEQLSILPDQNQISSYLNELAFVFLEIAPGLRDDAAIGDAAWSDPSIANGRIVSFEKRGERALNPTVDAARAFQEFAPEGVTLNKAEQLVMYVRMLKQRAHG